MGKRLVGNVTLVLWTEAMAGNMDTELMPIFWWSKLKEEGRRKSQGGGTGTETWKTSSTWETVSRRRKMTTTTVSTKQ